MKRTKTLTAITIGLTVSAFVLSGCIEEDTSPEVSTNVYPNLDACIAEARNQADDMKYSPGDITVTESMCRESYTDTMVAYTETAPRYDSKSLCEEQHGVAACQQEVRPDGTSVFLPLLAGYMVGRMMSGTPTATPTATTGPVLPPGANNGCDPRDKDCKSVGSARGSSFVYSPVYRNAAGGYVSSNGQTMTSNSTHIATKMSAFAKPPSTVRAAPMTIATVKSTGGFGASRTSFGSIGAHSSGG